MYTLERILPTFKCTFMSAAITFSLVNEFIFTKEDQSTENIKDYHRSDCAMILLMDSCKKTTPNQMAFIGATNVHVPSSPSQQHAGLQYAVLQLKQEVSRLMAISMPEKNRQMSIKVVQKWFH